MAQIIVDITLSLGMFGLASIGLAVINSCYNRHLRRQIYKRRKTWR